MSIYDTLKKRRYVCSNDGTELIEIRWGRDPLPLCCGVPMVEVSLHPTNRATAVIGDECDVQIKHGLCNEDGTPRRFTSKSDIKKAAFERNYTQGTDTPHPNQRIVEREQQQREEGYRRGN